MKRNTIAIAVAAAALAASLAAPLLGQAPRQQFRLQGGEAVFTKLCAACHMADGRGYSGLYPALARNPRLAAPSYPMMVVMNGQNAMPAMGKMLSDQQIADVVNYVRGNLGNTYKPVTTPAEVAALRR